MMPLIYHFFMFVLALISVFWPFVLLGFSLSEGRAGGDL